MRSKRSPCWINKPNWILPNLLVYSYRQCCRQNRISFSSDCNVWTEYGTLGLLFWIIFNSQITQHFIIMNVVAVAFLLMFSERLLLRTMFHHLFSTKNRRISMEIFRSDMNYISSNSLRMSQIQNIGISSIYSQFTANFSWI